MGGQAAKSAEHQPNNRHGQKIFICAECYDRMNYSNSNCNNCKSINLDVCFYPFSQPFTPTEEQPDVEEKLQDSSQNVCVDSETTKRDVISNSGGLEQGIAPRISADDVLTPDITMALLQKHATLSLPWKNEEESCNQSVELQELSYSVTDNVEQLPFILKTTFSNDKTDAATSISELEIPSISISVGIEDAQYANDSIIIHISPNSSIASESSNIYSDITQISSPHLPQLVHIKLDRSFKDSIYKMAKTVPSVETFEISHKKRSDYMSEVDPPRTELSSNSFTSLSKYEYTTDTEPILKKSLLLDQSIEKRKLNYPTYGNCLYVNSSTGLVTPKTEYSGINFLDTKEIFHEKEDTNSDISFKNKRSHLRKTDVLAAVDNDNLILPVSSSTLISDKSLRQSSMTTSQKEFLNIKRILDKNKIVHEGDLTRPVGKFPSNMALRNTGCTLLSVSERSVLSGGTTSNVTFSSTKFPSVYEELQKIIYLVEGTINELIPYLSFEMMQQFNNIYNPQLFCTLTIIIRDLKIAKCMVDVLKQPGQVFLENKYLSDLQIILSKIKKSLKEVEKEKQLWLNVKANRRTLHLDIFDLLKPPAADLPISRSNSLPSIKLSTSYLNN